MAEFLFIKPAELTQGTIIGGTVDTDKYMTSVAHAQTLVVEPLLGTELYDKIKTEAQADALTGDYLTLYNEYVKPITKNESAARYILLANYSLDNIGLNKKTAANAQIVEQTEVGTVSQTYSNMAQVYVQRFYKWIGKNPLTEYKTYQDEVNAEKNISLPGGLYFG